MFIVDSLNKLLRGGETRSTGIRKNIAASFLIRGISLAINFSVVPLTIQYIEPVRYGIWVTLVSLITWFTFFDFGMSNGLRNTLTTALANEDYDKAKRYVSTTYAVILCIALTIFLSFSLINPLIQWNTFLNIPSSVNDDIHHLVLLIVGTFCIQFVVQIINTVLTSLHKPAKAEFLTLLGQALLLMGLLILKLTVKGSLHVMVLAFNVAPIIVLISASIFYYKQKLRPIAPSFRYVDFRYAKIIFNIGGAFFLIQIGALVLFQTDNIIITRVLGPEAVTRFSVTHKMFSIIIMAFSIVATPYWSAFTDAYAKKDFSWIRSSIKKLREIWFFTVCIIIPGFLIATKFLFKIWLPDTITIDFGIALLMAAYTACYTCLTLNCYFLNGVGKLRIQVFLYLVVMITNVPLGFVLCEWWGVEGVILANIIAFVFMNLVLWIQTNKVIAHKASGVWNL